MGLATAAVLGSFVLVFVVETLLTAAGVPVGQRPELQIGLSLLLVQGVTFGGLSVFYLRLGRRDYVHVRVPTRSDLAWMVGGSVAMFLSMVVVTATLSTLGIHSARNVVERLGVEDPNVFLLLVPAAFLVVGPGEELLFRGVIQSRLRESFSPAVAVLLATVLFAATHVLSLGGTFQARVATIASLFVISLVLGVAYERTGNLLVNAFVHGCYDASLFLLAYLTLR